MGIAELGHGAKCPHMLGVILVFHSVEDGVDLTVVDQFGDLY